LVYFSITGLWLRVMVLF